MSGSGMGGGRGWFDRLIDALAALAGVTLCALTTMICVDVAARYFRLFSMPWSLDIAEAALLVVTFLGAPWVLRDNAHISVDILVERFPPPLRRRVTLLSHGVGALVCAALLAFSTRAWWSSFSQGTMVNETFVYPEWLMFVIPPPVFLLMVVIFVRWIVTPDEGKESSFNMTSDGI